MSTKEWRAKNKERARAHFKKWYLKSGSEYRERNRDRFREICNKYNNSKKGRLKLKRLQEKYPEKYRARLKLREAVYKKRKKKLPCRVCGNVKSQGHHTDYRKPLEVIWLCDIHHKEIHKK